MSNGKYKKLAFNSIIFSIANFGSAILRFIIVPFYTFYLSTAEYGTVDMISTTVSLLLPIFIFSLNEAALRYCLKEDVENRTVFVNCFLIMLINTILLIPSYFITLFAGISFEFWAFFYITLIFQSIYTVLMSFTRGIGKSIPFAIGGLLNTGVLLTSNIILLAVFRMGLNGYMVSLVGSYIVPSLFYLIVDRKCISLSREYFDFSVLKKMLKYSIPLIPTAMMWWIMNASDRYVITWFLGVSATGIYAVSHKIPSIIQMVYTIFQQAWQISAIEEQKSEDRSAFYSEIYIMFCDFLMIAASIVILIVKPVIIRVVEPSFSDAWVYTPCLIIGAVFSSLAGFLGINYVVTERTSGAFFTSAITALINICLNVVLTPLIGMQGTAIATMIGFIALWAIRVKDTQKIISFEQHIGSIFFQSILLIIESLLIVTNIPFHFVLGCMAIAIMITFDRKSILYLLNMIKSLRKAFVRK